MPHNHSHSHNNATKNIGIAFILNFIFAIIELVGGLLTNSIAILSDALHDFGDCLSLGVALLLQKKSQQKSDKSYSYGYKRFSLLGSVFLSGVLAVSSVFVLVEAIKRIINPQAVSAEGMLWLAILGIVVNGAAVLRLKKGSSLNEKAVFLHLMEDVLGWIAVLIASLVMLFVNLPILDPILSVCITLWVLFNVYKNLKDTFKILLQATPEGVDVKEITKAIELLDAVESTHDAHIWSLDGQSHVMTIHLVTKRNLNTEEQGNLKCEVRAAVLKFNIEHITIEIEALGELSCEYLECCK